MHSVLGTLSTPAGDVLAEDVALTFFSVKSGSFTVPPRSDFAKGRSLVLVLSDGKSADVRITGEVPARSGAVVYGFTLLSRPT